MPIARTLDLTLHAKHLPHPKGETRGPDIIWKAVDVFLGSVGVPAMCYFLQKVCKICTAVGAAQIGLHRLGVSLNELGLAIKNAMIDLADEGFREVERLFVGDELVESCCRC